MAKVIAIANQKGGVGKTTTCVNLSSCVAALGKKVLVVDLDPQGNTTSGYGVAKKGQQSNIYTCLINDDDIRQAIVHTKFNADLIASNTQLAGAVVELVELAGQEQLFFPAFPLDACIIKGSTADADGNISMEKEAFLLEQYEMAAAAHNSGGLVLAQVDQLAPAHTMNAKDVVVPGCLVDYIVVGREENSRQQFVTEDRWVEAFTGRVRIPLEPLVPPDIKKVMARRAAAEIKDGDFVNFGIGVPTLITNVLAEEKRLERVTLSIESGTIGGAPQGGLLTGAAYNADAMIKQPDIFDLYDGGGIDVACLGGAEFDREGNVNVSRFGEKIPGPGGFINISQGAKKVCFMGSFTAGESEIRLEGGRLRIIKDGNIRKFRQAVGHITFSGEYSNQKGTQQVLYITERAVFRLTPEGLLLCEIAPGVDLRRDILEKMEFTPLIAPDLREMDAALFTE